MTDFYIIIYFWVIFKYTLGYMLKSNYTKALWLKFFVYLALEKHFRISQIKHVLYFVILGVLVYVLNR